MDEEGLKKLRSDGYNVRLMDAESLRLGEKFDVVIAGEIIEHLPNPGRFLERARAHLADGGELIVTVPNARSLDSRSSKKPSRTTPEPLRGMQQHTQALAEGLVKRGHEVTVITTRHPQKESEEVNGVKIHYLKNTKPGKYSRTGACGYP